MSGTDDIGSLTARSLAGGGALGRLSWLRIVGGVLLLALAAAVLVQTRQFRLLRQMVDSADEAGVLAVEQVESGYLRLREAWQRAADERQPLDPAALRQACQGWLGSVEALRSGPARRLAQSTSEHRPTLDEIAVFVAEADHVLGAMPASATDRDALRALWPRLDALDKPLRGLSQGAWRQMTAQAEQRNQSVRLQNQLGLGLTVFLSVLTLAFAGLALHHLNQLRERRLVLEELTAKLRQARRDAEAASEAKSMFLANMSHEIRTPFHGLMGMLSLLRETGLTPRQIDHLRTATESADHLLAILNDILDMSQLEAGRMTLSPAPVAVRGLLRDVAALMRPQANATALALHLDADPGVPERVVADATRVRQILFNLLSNAIKFSEHGAVVLDVRVRGAEGSAAQLEFVVTDTGVGMDAATQARLFRRFVQGDGSRSRRHGGTGLGLEISRNLARLMGGDIGVRSKPGEGSAFTFSMPLPSLPAIGPVSAAAASPADAPSRALQVLVAEDHPVNRQYIAALLESLGHDAHFTANGQEAVQAARERRFDVVLMDLHMPVLDGVGATRAIRALPDRAAATVPIVALTADAFEQTRERCLVAGMNDFLTKPVSPQKLATSLRRLFGSTASGGMLSPETNPPPPAQPGNQLIDNNALQMALQAMPPRRLAEMIEAFLDQGPQTVMHLRSAVRGAQPLELRVNAHAAKGAALNLGLSALAATAAALQDGAAHLPAHEIARLVQRFEELLPLTREAARAAGLPLSEAAAAVTR